MYIVHTRLFKDIRDIWVFKSPSELKLKIINSRQPYRTFEFPSQVNLSGPRLYCTLLYGQDYPVQQG